LRFESDSGGNISVYEPRKKKPGERIGAAERRMIGMRTVEVGEPNQELIAKGLFRLVRSELATPEGQAAFFKIIEKSKQSQRKSAKTSKKRRRRRARTSQRDA
jgi:hypothetical protein